jgi:hypothetical protein
MQDPDRRKQSQLGQRVWGFGIGIAVFAWGVYLAVGAWRFNRDIRKGLLVLGCTLAFLLLFTAAWRAAHRR